jgi:hypothetical protein
MKPRMKLIAAAICMATAFSAEAARLGGAPRAAVRFPGHVHVHPAHVRGSVFVGVGVGLGLGFAPYAWPGYYYPAPVYAAPPPPPVAYWYYCAPLGAYYPYVASCPGPWQPVAPTPYSY